MIPELRDRFSKAAELVKGHRKVHLFSHYDADGISSLSIVASVLERNGIEYTYDIFPTLGPKQMEVVMERDFDCMIMTDMGTSFIKDIASKGKDCVILDHHEPNDDVDDAHVAFVNCHNAGIDGSYEVCAATMAYLFAQYMGDNRDLVNIAIAGMIGDKQHIGGFKGINSRIIESAVKDGLIVRTEETILPPGDIRRALFESLDPYIIGISGDREGVEGLLGSCDPEDLEDRIISMLKEQGVREKVIDECIQPRYYLERYGMDAERFSRIIDACGRRDMESAGIELCLRGSNDEAEHVYESFIENNLSKTVELVRNGTRRMSHIQYFMCDTKGIAGSMGGTYSRYVGDPMIPIIGLRIAGDIIDVSSRCSSKAIEYGINMAVAMNRGAASVGGNGGGHMNAAGATIPNGRMEEFLEAVNEIVRRQIEKN